MSSIYGFVKLTVLYFVETKKRSAYNSRISSCNIYHTLLNFFIALSYFVAMASSSYNIISFLLLLHYVLPASNILPQASFSCKLK